MKRYLFILGIYLFFSFDTNAQFYELGIGVGGTQYSGDLDAPDFSTNLAQTQFAFNLFFKYNLDQRFGLKASYLRGTVQASDSNSDQLWQLQRNLSFSSSINEFAALLEINLFKFDPYDDRTSFVTPYLFGGVALFKFNPTTEYLGQTVSLQPLGTEGQGLPGYDEKYSLTEFSIPFGGGLKIRLSEKMIIGLEIGARKTFTDYIDDVSTVYADYDILRAGNGELAAALSNRKGEYLENPDPTEAGSARGKSTIKDYYLTGMLNFSYRFESLFSFGSNQGVGCPTF